MKDIELFNDSFQNYKSYQLPKAQLILTDVPYVLGVNAYASNPTWYVDGDNKNGESDKAGIFGTKESFALQGQFVYVYVTPDSLMPFMDRTGIKPTYTLSFEDDNTTINIYQL